MCDEGVPIYYSKGGAFIVNAALAIQLSLKLFIRISLYSKVCNWGMDVVKSIKEQFMKTKPLIKSQSTAAVL